MYHFSRQKYEIPSEILQGDRILREFYRFLLRMSGFLPKDYEILQSDRPLDAGDLEIFMKHILEVIKGRITF